MQSVLSSRIARCQYVPSCCLYSLLIYPQHFETPMQTLRIQATCTTSFVYCSTLKQQFSHYSTISLKRLDSSSSQKPRKVTKNSTMRPTTRTAATTTKSQNDSHIFNTHRRHELAVKRPIRAACCNFVYAMKRKNAYWPYWEILLPRVRALLSASLLSPLQFKKDPELCPPK